MRASIHCLRRVLHVCSQVMTDGSTPYGDLKQLDQVAEHVRAGNVLECPPDCNRQV
jgi:hypothetical protein